MLEDWPTIVFSVYYVYKCAGFCVHSLIFALLGLLGYVNASDLCCCVSRHRYSNTCRYVGGHVLVCGVDF